MHDSISEKTDKMLSSTIGNFKKGKVGEEFDEKKYEVFLMAESDGESDGENVF